MQRVGQVEYNKPYRGDLVGRKIKVIASNMIYNSASDDPNAIDGSLVTGTYMIVAYVDSDPANSSIPIFILVADPEKNVYMIPKDDTGTKYKVLSAFPLWIVPLVAIGLYFAFSKKRRYA